MTDVVDTAVAFTAYATTFREYDNGDVIIFDHIITNVGNHFSAATNKFTCPRRGLYLFSLTLYLSDIIYGAIMLNGNEIGEVRGTSGVSVGGLRGGANQNSITTTVVCEANQMVWIEQDNESERELRGYSDDPVTMFTGVLIQSF